MRARAELSLLRVLCQTETSPQMRNAILDALAAHRFAEPEHEVLFAALRDLQGVGKIATEQRVAEMLLRRGFPDLDLSGYFTGARNAVSSNEISAALREIARR